MLFAIPVVALLVGLAKGGLGGALGGTIVPILSIFMPVQDALAMSLPLFIVGDWLSVRAYWMEWNTYHLKLLLPLAFLGVVLGTYMLANLSSDTLRVILGVMTLIVGAYKLLEPRLKQLRYVHARWHGVLAGGLAGTGAALASAGGPVFTAYLLLQRLSPRVFIGTTAIFFAIVNIVRLPGFILADLLKVDVLWVLVWFTPLVWAGVALGRRFIHYINPVWFDHMMTALLIAAGIILLVR